MHTVVTTVSQLIPFSKNQQMYYSSMFRGKTSFVPYRVYKYHTENMVLACGQSKDSIYVRGEVYPDSCLWTPNLRHKKVPTFLIMRDTRARTHTKPSVLRLDHFDIYINNFPKYDGNGRVTIRKFTWSNTKLRQSERHSALSCHNSESYFFFKKWPKCAKCLT